MKKIISQSNIEDVCQGHIFVGCAIRTDDIVYLLARKDLTEDEAAEGNDYEIPTRVILLHERQDCNELQVGAVDINNFELPQIGISLKPIAQALLLANDNHGSILPIGGGKDTWPFETLLKKGMPMCRRLRCIDGYTWAACSRRLVFKRTDIGQWVNVRKGFDASMSPLGETKNKDCGFKDIDGFSEKEIYAVGGKGDIWRFDGDSWSQCGFPTNDYLCTVCCAKDGNVYVGARNGLWRGKEHHWERICEFEKPEEMNDLRWFDNKLWLAYDYRLLYWDGSDLHSDIIYKDKKISLGGNIDSSENMLFVTRSYETWTYDGKDWYNIIPNFN
ncbi:hypothetical protein [Enterobacillus tribolii]|uniref:Uncharacterized protein n=1 Tax=Enterobacillus tribolii TaxID=1487935 RepID=A0A370R2T9_9GAMM|nr:hypothetical protein [Enterobacillus tribolii]MBW7984760.1 hypothetical protein [Enterobacillus tribolii]RDK96761.1 hypothetical protein C8D90_101197 [Enterobacillus tribolii]